MQYYLPLALLLNALILKKRKPFFFEQDNATFMPQQTADDVEAKAHHYHWEH